MKRRQPRTTRTDKLLPDTTCCLAQTASIVANIRAVTLAFKDGGEVRGPGGPRSDSVNAKLSNGEFVVNAHDTAKNKPLLEAINSGQDISAAKKQTAAVGAAAVNAATNPLAASASPVPLDRKRTRLNSSH